MVFSTFSESAQYVVPPPPPRPNFAPALLLFTMSRSRALTLSGSPIEISPRDELKRCRLEKTPGEKKGGGGLDWLGGMIDEAVEGGFARGEKLGGKGFVGGLKRGSERVTRVFRVGESGVQLSGCLFDENFHIPFLSFR